VTVPDRPGELATLLGRVSGLGANVVDVSHSRIGSLALGDVVVELSLEARGHEHCQEVLADLDAAGYRVER
jgi:threonine dehydratase